MKFYIIITTLLIDLLFIGSLYFFLRQIKFNHGFWLYAILILFSVLFTIIILKVKFDTKVKDTLMLKKFYLVASLFILFYIPKIVFIVFFITNKLLFLIEVGTFSMLRIFNLKEIHPFSLSFITYTGLTLTAIMFVFILYGMVFGRFNYKVEKVDIAFSNLPDKFNNFRIVQVSDIHLGTLAGDEKNVKKAVDIINNLDADIVLFTGDLVNNYSEEALGWSPILSQIKSKHKKYSVLGNHDYGDYWDWDSKLEKEENLRLLLKIQEEMGFTLLMNESDTIAIDGQVIGITGVENWGKPPFHQFGDLKKAMMDSKKVPFRILLSHDPSHWESEVRYLNSIDLTLSGHTHGMQFGIKIGKFQWSPVKYIYKFWSGLYENKGKYLYVNRGLGHIGFLGRAGMRPEITLITLKTLN